MRFATSYFYQIRNFRLYGDKKSGNRIAMIPISTALYDPKWYVRYNEHNRRTIWIDKNNIINGYNDHTLNPDPHSDYCTRCDIHDPSGPCQFIKEYSEKLSKINARRFLEYYRDILQKSIAKFYAEYIKDPIDEVEFVFIVHESPTKACSERGSLQKFLAQFNLGCKEFDPSRFKE